MEKAQKIKRKFAHKKTAGPAGVMQHRPSHKMSTTNFGTYIEDKNITVRLYIKL